MTTKLTQKQLVDLFNQGAAPFQQAIDDANLKYKEAIVLFATKYLGLTSDKWQEGVNDYMEDLVAQDYVIEACSDDLQNDFTNHYLAHEYALRHTMREMFDGSVAYEDLNVKG